MRNRRKPWRELRTLLSGGLRSSCTCVRQYSLHVLDEDACPVEIEDVPSYVVSLDLSLTLQRYTKSGNLVTTGSVKFSPKLHELKVTIVQCLGNRRFELTESHEANRFDHPSVFPIPSIPPLSSPPSTSGLISVQLLRASTSLSPTLSRKLAVIIHK